MSDGAENVAGRLSAHEAVCAERWGEIRRRLDSMGASIQSLWWVVLSSAGALIIGMATLIVTLVLKGR